MSNSLYQQKRWLHLALIIVGLISLMMIYFSVRVAFPGIKTWVVWVAVFQLLVTLLWTLLHTFRTLNQYAQSFYDLTPSDAGQLVRRSLIRLRRYPPAGPSLSVADGRADPEGPTVVYEIGGPAYLGVGHNSVAVTERLGKLVRVMGPGFGPLEPYERVWDVVDLRPQYQHPPLRVEFMTRDGIPAYCDAEMTFQIATTYDPKSEKRYKWVRADLKKVQGDSESQRNKWDTPYPYSEDAVFSLVTAKYVTSSTDPQAIARWTTGITRGALDGEIRDELEKYWLDQFLDPIATLESDPVSETEIESGLLKSEMDNQDGNGQEGTARDEPREKRFLPEIEAIIAEKMRETGRQRGIKIENVELTELKPDDQAISQQWLDYWQARVQAGLDEYHARGRLARVRKIQLIRADIKAELIQEVLSQVMSSSEKDGIVEFSSDLIITEFLDVLESMCGQGPEMQRLAFQQAESLIRVINAIQQGDSPFGPTTGAVFSSYPPDEGQ